MNDFLQENKLLCSLWGVGSDKSSVSRDAAAHPSPTLHKVSDNHTPLRAAWENPCGEPGLSHPISFSSLIYPTASTPFLQVTPSFASKALLESNLIFQHSNLQNSKRGGAGGAEDWLAFSYVMDEHTP